MTNPLFGKTAGLVLNEQGYEVRIIAITGKFNGNMPTGVIADAFFSNGDYQPKAFD